LWEKGKKVRGKGKHSLAWLAEGGKKRDKGRGGFSKIQILQQGSKTILGGEGEKLSSMSPNSLEKKGRRKGLVKKKTNVRETSGAIWKSLEGGDPETEGSSVSQKGALKKDLKQNIGYGHKT